MKWETYFLIAVFLLAPFIGGGLVLVGFEQQAEALALPLEGVDQAADRLESSVSNLWQNTAFLSQVIAEQEREYKEQEKILQELASRSQDQKEMSDQMYEKRILTMLGPAIDSYRSQRVDIKVFKLDELGYRGYIAKAKLFDPSVVKVVLGQDKLGESETTSSAVQRTGAILGVNGGGFYSAVKDGKTGIFPIGNTIVDGEFVTGFHPSNGEVFFAGISQYGKLIGGHFREEKALLNLKPVQGVSFLPILIQGGKPLPLPQEWKNTKHPRTIIGEYANGDFILIVVDGRQSDWSSGVTLERLQIKLIELGVKEGYNLDGGGSSAMVFKGQVLNRPSDGKQRPVANNIVIMP